MPRRLAAALLAPVLFAAAVPPAAAADDTLPPRLEISGEGEVHVAPDMAILSLTVLREAETARDALSASNSAMHEVLRAMKDAGIAERDLQTTAVSLRPRYHHPGKDNTLKEPKIIGYSASNSLTVRVRDLKTVGAVLDKSVTLGVNQGGNLRFVNDDTTAAMKEARRRAVADALARAQTLAAAAGIKLGRVVRMSEQSSRPRPLPIARPALAAAPQAEAVPLAAGENSYRAVVDMVFAIEP